MKEMNVLSAHKSNDGAVEDFTKQYLILNTDINSQDGGVNSNTRKIFQNCDRQNIDELINKFNPHFVNEPEVILAYR